VRAAPEHLFHGGDIRAWLYTILTNLNRNWLRCRRARRCSRSRTTTR
jgi:RNA polymerase sigma-70 factor (ECF subfamily)